MKDNTTNIRRPWPWWLRTPHSRLFSEWIEHKSDPQKPTTETTNRAA